MYKNKCLFCNVVFDNKSKNKMYCSIKCTKKMSYHKRHKNSLHNNPEEFYKSDTGRGYKWEKYVANLLKAQHLEFNGKDEKTNRADIKWGEKYIDVKSAVIYKRKNKRGKPVMAENKGCWSFKPSYIKDNIDYIFCVALDKDDKVVKKYLVPSSAYPAGGITVGQTSKYDIYLY